MRGDRPRGLKHKLLPGAGLYSAGNDIGQLRHALLLTAVCKAARVEPWCWHCQSLRGCRVDVSQRGLVWSGCVTARSCLVHSLKAGQER